jgi:predicted Zn finger-like uncharacterized protein
MNYITSCPACETQFLLTKAHLKAHRGKVQCGHCEHIFNAKNRLTEISDDITSAAEYQASIEAQVSEASQANEEKPMSEVLNVVLESVPNLENLESSNVHVDEIVIEANDAYEADTPIVIEDLTASPKFRQRKTKTSSWLILFGLFLTVLAGLQTIYYQRTKIAAEYPQFKPYLVQACAVLKCEISLPKNLDLLAIDDSDMQEDENHQNVIRFSSLLINNAPYAQTYPNIELTLTDTSDQPVLRKIIPPAEYLANIANVATGIASRDEVRINLAINVTDLAVAGYRVLLVY